MCDVVIDQWAEDDDPSVWDALGQEADRVAGAGTAAVTASSSIADDQTPIVHRRRNHHSESYYQTRIRSIETLDRRKHHHSKKRRKQLTLHNFIEFDKRFSESLHDETAANGRLIGQCCDAFNQRRLSSKLCLIRRESSETWVYPTNMQLRKYQFEISKQALFRNTLVCVPTGMGKTFIAAVVIYNYWRWYISGYLNHTHNTNHHHQNRRGKIVFCAPTRALVDQQMRACLTYLDIPAHEYCELTGRISSKKRPLKWTMHSIIFCSPQTLQSDLNRGSVPINQLVLLILDEAHKAKGEHSYSVVTRDLLHNNPDLRVLALSATPGRDRNGIQQVSDLLRIQHFELRTEDDPDLIAYAHHCRIDVINVTLSPKMNAFLQRILSLMESMISQLSLLRVMTWVSAGQLSTFQMQKVTSHITGEYRAKIGNGGDDHSKKNTNINHHRHSQQQYWTALFTAQCLRKCVGARDRLEQYSLTASLTKLRSVIEPSEPGKRLNRISLKMSRDPSFLCLLTDMESYIHRCGNHPKLEELQLLLESHFNNDAHQKSTQLSSDNNNQSETISKECDLRRESRVIIFTSLRESVNDIVDSIRVKSALRSGVIHPTNAITLASSQLAGFNNNNNDDDPSSSLLVLSQQQSRQQSSLLSDQQPLVRPFGFVGQACSSSNGGQSFSKGLRQSEQLRIVDDFKRGKYNVLVSTHVGEEGLDIGSVDLVIHYDVTSDVLRNIQRNGRTGRKRDGRVVYLVCGQNEESSLKQFERQRKKLAKIDGKNLDFSANESFGQSFPKGFRPALRLQKLEGFGHQYKNSAERDAEERRITEHQRLKNGRSKRANARTVGGSSSSSSSSSNGSSSLNLWRTATAEQFDQIKKRFSKVMLDCDTSDIRNVIMDWNPSSLLDSLTMRQIERDRRMRNLLSPHTSSGSVIIRNDLYGSRGGRWTAGLSHLQCGSDSSSMIVVDLDSAKFLESFLKSCEEPDELAMLKREVCAQCCDGDYHLKYATVKRYLSDQEKKSFRMHIDPHHSSEMLDWEERWEREGLGDDSGRVDESYFDTMGDDHITMPTVMHATVEDIFAVDNGNGDSSNDDDNDDGIVHVEVPQPRDSCEMSMKHLILPPPLEKEENDCLSSEIETGDNIYRVSFQQLNFTVDGSQHNDTNQSDGLYFSMDERIALSHQIREATRDHSTVINGIRIEKPTQSSHPFGSFKHAKNLSDMLKYCVKRVGLFAEEVRRGHVDPICGKSRWNSFMNHDHRSILAPLLRFDDIKEEKQPSDPIVVAHSSELNDTSIERDPLPSAAGICHEKENENDTTLCLTSQSSGKTSCFDSSGFIMSHHHSSSLSPTKRMNTQSWKFSKARSRRRLSFTSNSPSKSHESLKFTKAIDMISQSQLNRHSGDVNSNSGVRNRIVRINAPKFQSDDVSVDIPTMMDEDGEEDGKRKQKDNNIDIDLSSPTPAPPNQQPSSSSSSSSKKRTFSELNSISNDPLLLDSDDDNDGGSHSSSQSSSMNIDSGISTKRRKIIDRDSGVIRRQRLRIRKSDSDDRNELDESDISQRSTDSTMTREEERKRRRRRSSSDSAASSISSSSTSQNSRHLSSGSSTMTTVKRRRPLGLAALIETEAIHSECDDECGTSEGSEEDNDPALLTFDRSDPFINDGALSFVHSPGSTPGSSSVRRTARSERARMGAMSRHWDPKNDPKHFYGMKLDWIEECENSQDWLSYSSQMDPMHGLYCSSDEGDFEGDCEDDREESGPGSGQETSNDEGRDAKVDSDNNQKSDESEKRAEEHSEDERVEMNSDDQRSHQSEKEESKDIWYPETWDELSRMIDEDPNNKHSEIVVNNNDDHDRGGSVVISSAELSGCARVNEYLRNECGKIPFVTSDVSYESYIIGHSSCVLRKNDKDFRESDNVNEIRNALLALMRRYQRVMLVIKIDDDSVRMSDTTRFIHQIKDFALTLPNKNKNKNNHSQSQLSIVTASDRISVAQCVVHFMKHTNNQSGLHIPDSFRRNEFFQQSVRVLYQCPFLSYSECITLMCHMDWNLSRLVQQQCDSSSFSSASSLIDILPSLKWNNRADELIRFFHREFIHHNDDSNDDDLKSDKMLAFEQYDWTNLQFNNSKRRRKSSSLASVTTSETISAPRSTESTISTISVTDE